MKYLTLKNRQIIILGFGTIGPAVLPLILKHIQINPEQITIIDASNANKEIAEKAMVNFKPIVLTPKNYEEVLSKYLEANDILLNLSVNISSLDIIKLCQKRGVLYLDTANDTWPIENISNKLTSFDRRNKVLELKPAFKNGPTALICHGANPGLVSHFAKHAVLDIAKKVGVVKENKDAVNWGQLAQELGITTIHISEKDTQCAAKPRNNNEYVNTWSVKGFLEEIAEFAIFAWGSHENELEENIVRRRENTDKLRMIELGITGGATLVNSWVPSCRNFQGYVIPHPESFSLGELFSYKNNDNSIYHPTVHFVYLPCTDAVKSMNETAQTRRLDPNKQSRLLMHDIISGMDELGILILRKNTSEIYWYGSRLGIDTVRGLAPHNNATSLQVAAAVLSGLVWIIENPNLGLVEPEDADFERILEIAAPYLGALGGEWSTWEITKDSLEGDNEISWNFSNLAVSLTT